MLLRLRTIDLELVFGVLSPVDSVLLVIPKRGVSVGLDNNSIMDRQCKWARNPQSKEVVAKVVNRSLYALSDR